MIKPFDSIFLTPTKKFRRLSVLMSIHDSANNSQHKIGRMAHLSSSMVNNYIKEFQKEGLIRINGQTNRSLRYHLTPGGRNELIRLLLAYSTEIIQLYGASKQELTRHLSQMHAEGISTVALFGAAETAEVVHAAIKGTPLTVCAVLDSDPARQDKPFNGLTVEKPEKLRELAVDAVIITSFAKQAEIEACIRDQVGDRIKIKTLSDL